MPDEMQYFDHVPNLKGKPFLNLSSHHFQYDFNNIHFLIKYLLSIVKEIIQD